MRAGLCHYVTRGCGPVLYVRYYQYFCSFILKQPSRAYFVFQMIFPTSIYSFIVIALILIPKTKYRNPYRCRIIDSPSFTKHYKPGDILKSPLKPCTEEGASKHFTCRSRKNWVVHFCLPSPHNRGLD